MALTMLGCSNPGYSVYIDIKEDTQATTRDISNIRDFIMTVPHEVVGKKSEDNWLGESYRILLSDASFNQFKHKYVGISIETYLSETVVNGNIIIERAQIRIANILEGRTPPLKAEIDDVADAIISILNQHIEKPKIAVSRAYTRPI